MRYLYILLFLISTSISAQSLDAVREFYVHVNEGDKAISKFEKSLEATKQNSNVKDAFNGALMTMQSKLVKGVKNKKALFREGVLLIETAITKDPTNIEIRTIRLSIQENAPKFLKYHNAINEDKELILASFANITTPAVHSFVKGYVKQSSVFTDEEKSRL